MKPIVVSDILAVGEVPSADQLAILAKAGFRSVINSQPDGEVERFPGSAVLGADAKRQGLGYAYAPVVSRTPSDEELAVFRQALNELPSPIYAFCYSGARAAVAAAFVETGAREPDAIIADFAGAGFDIASLKPWLDDERKRRKAAAIVPGASGHNGAISQANAIRREPTAEPKVPAVAAAMELKSIIVHARAAGYSGFAM